MHNFKCKKKFIFTLFANQKLTLVLLYWYNNTDFGTVKDSFFSLKIPYRFQMILLAKRY